MDDMCNDNRFELIEKYKKRLIEATNIETAPDEMAVLDDILFRFWQMGWLDKLEQRWIPVSETSDIPEKEVLACDKYGTELIGFLAGADGRYECESDECIMYDVVAYMPLPEPYRGES